MYSLARIKGNEKREAPKKCLFSGLSGAPYWIRTSGLTLRRRALYPAELMALIWDCGAQGECTSSHLGGVRSILLSDGRGAYGVLCRSAGVEGECSILLRGGKRRKILWLVRQNPPKHYSG